MSGARGVERGRLIVFEGAEGVGKTTQIAGLAARLAQSGVRHARFREPGGTALGDEIRRLLLSPAAADVGSRAEALLFMAARAQLMETVRETLSGGAHVLLDRYFLSTYAYQIAGRGLPPRLVRDANALAVGDLTPDLTFLLTCAPAVARARMLARGDLDRMEQEDAAFHERVRAGFAAAAEPSWQAEHPEIGPVVAIDGDGSADAVGARIDAALRARWPETFRTLGESH